MVIRKHARYSASWMVTVIHNGVEYTGTVRNMSRKGCSLKCDFKDFVGMHIRIRMDATYVGGPLCIERAFVRWTRAAVMGIEFVKVAEAEQIRLIRLIEALEQATPKPSPLQPISIPALRSFSDDQVERQTVLIVDDEEAILGICAVILEEARFKVLKARDSSHALQICTLHQGPIDLLLTDLVLVPRGLCLASQDNQYPQVHGHELAVRASMMRPDLRVAFMSGNQERDLAAYGIKRGTLPFLSKPFSMERLVQFVKDALAKDILVLSRQEK